MLRDIVVCTYERGLKRSYDAKTKTKTKTKTGYKKKKKNRKTGYIRYILTADCSDKWQDLHPSRGHTHSVYIARARSKDHTYCCCCSFGKDELRCKSRSHGFCLVREKKRAYEYYTNMQHASKNMERDVVPVVLLLLYVRRKNWFPRNFRGTLFWKKKRPDDRCRHKVN